MEPISFQEPETSFPWQADDPRVRDIAEERVRRLRDWLTARGFDAVLLSRRENFAWLTGGGDNHVLKPTEVGVGHLLVTPTQKYLLAYTMDGERVLSEEVPGQGYDLVTVRWYEDEPRLRALTLAGKRIAADTDFPGVEDCSLELIRMHAPLALFERNRYRWLAYQTGLALEEIARWVRPGLTEQEVARQITTTLISRGMDVDVLLVGSDERMERIRHVVPSPKKIDRFVLFNPTARRWGLHANVSRCVCFGLPKDSLKRAFQAALEIEAKILGKLTPGLPFSQLLDCQKTWYAEAGYPEEWRKHFQGGTTGYTISDASLGLTEERIQGRQAFDYFVTLPGVMVEELVLLWDGQLEVASRGTNWPVIAFPGTLGDINLPALWIA
jgi:Xaa-Pro aminopeptidase